MNTNAEHIIIINNTNYISIDDDVDDDDCD